MTTAQPTDRKDMTDRAMEEIRRWKENRRKGKLVLHFGGDGTVAQIESRCFIK